MDKADVPESFGVFKPVGHVVIAWRSAADLQAGVDNLTAQGVDAATLVRYSPQEMIAQVDAQLPNVSPLASLGQELNLIHAHRALAVAGCSFLVVPTDDDARAALVGEVAHALGAAAAQRYGRFIVEELITANAADTQHAESPATGLDLPTQAR